ncbi:PEGA domain-containing protein [Haliangium sp.]|uniref:PEGA domain-containing protein n=1 Tax=Haliangium sp. TaxID=2663208 RepID=UPI003D10BF0B
MPRSPWKQRLFVLLPLLFVGSLASEAFAQAQEPPCPPRSRRARYTVRIDSVPPQATIILDDERCALGVTPWEGKLERGTVTFTIKKDGYEPGRRSFRVRRTRRLQNVPPVTLVKLPDPPKLEVTANADQNTFNAQVWVDGQQQGQVPLVLTVEGGRHLVEIRKEGFESFSQWIEAKEGERVTMNPVLKEIIVEKKGSVLVEADVVGAEVYVDGQRHPDLTPTLIGDLIEGPHVIEVRKEPAVPWKQTVTVVADKSVKVSAQLAATMKAPSGTVRVLSNIEGALVYIDGQVRGEVPQDLEDIEPGEHVVEVKAEGYLPREDRVTINAGQAVVLKLDLSPVPVEQAKDVGVVKVVSPVPEAAVFVDGERLGNAPQERELAPGEHYVVVTKPGYKKFEEKINIEVGQSITISAELRAVGALRVLSTPSGADVLLDGETIGKTPLNQDEIDVGPHVVAVRMDGHYDFEQGINIEGGQRTIVSAKLDMIDTGPTAGELMQEQRALSSFGARAMPLGRSTIDFAVGYPYYFEGQFTVGAGSLGDMAFDAGVMARTFFSRTEVAARARLTLVDSTPFSAGLFAQLGGGSNFVDDSGRNTLFVDSGLLASLSAFGSMTVTGRAYLNIWSDRHCPTEDNPDAIGVCDVAAYNSDPDRRERINTLLGINSADDLIERESGVRLMTSLVVEVAVWQRWSLWALFEGAPFQDERAAYTDLFSATFFTDDIGTYLRMGTTFKF